MKKNLLTFLFVIAFICVGVSAASAKDSSSLGNSVAVSKRLSVAKTISDKIKSLKARCAAGDCQLELDILLKINDVYGELCAPRYSGGCASDLERLLIRVADDYERCYYGNFAKNMDRDMDRNKIEKPRDIMSR